MPYNEEQRRRRKLWDYERTSGRQRRLTDRAQFEHVFEIVKAVHQRGMGCLDISEQTGVGRKLIDDIIYRPEAIQHMFRRNLVALEKVFYEDPPANRRGALVEPDLGRRRIHALWCAGYPMTWQAQQCGATPQHFSAIAKGVTTRMHASVLVRIRALYDKHIEVDPLEVGITERAKGRAISGGLGRGFAPASCWDDDTIDDPAAFPDWTGACGTVHGRTVHKREGIPMCDPCREARLRRPAEMGDTGWVLDGARLVSLMDHKEITKEGLAEALGVSHATISKWRTGLRQPSADRLEDLAEYFGIHVSELKL